MRNIFTAFLCALLAATSMPVAAQKSNKKTEEQKANENSVWFNARHGDAAAMNQIGVWYYTGNKVEKDYRQAYEWWRMGALRQNAKAIANLGVCYQYGRGVERDSIEAIRLYVTAIENGQQELFNQRLSNTPTSTFDDMLIGLCYEKGIGTKRNLKSAADIYALAAQKGSVDAMTAAGRVYYESGNNTDALKYLDMAKAKGDNYAAFLAGKIRLSNAANKAGDSVADIRKAAEKGIPEAQTELGNMYYTGRYVNADRREALDWLKKASESGDAEGMWQYGKALVNEKDYDEALFWLSMAAQAGRQYDFNSFIDSMPEKDGFRKYVNGMKAYLIGGNFAEATSDFQSVGKSKADEGKVMEMIVLADPANKKSNVSKAAKELSKIADDNTFAACALAAMYLDGNGVDHSSSRAISLYRKAANSGDGRAQNALANIYFEGKYTTPDRRAAAELYKKAYQQRRLDAKGAQNLRSLYETGSFGITADPAIALSLSNYNTADPIIETLKELN